MTQMNYIMRLILNWFILLHCDVFGIPVQRVRQSLLAEIVNSFQSLTVFAKISIINNGALSTPQYNSKWFSELNSVFKNHFSSFTLSSVIKHTRGCGGGCWVVMERSFNNMNNWSFHSSLSLHPF